MYCKVKTPRPEISFIILHAEPITLLTVCPNPPHIWSGPPGQTLEINPAMQTLESNPAIQTLETNPAC